MMAQNNSQPLDELVEQQGLEPQNDPTQSLTVEQAIANLSGPDLGLRFYAAWWLGKFRVREPAAIAALIQALEDEEDRTEAGGYPLRRNAARALGKLGDSQAVLPLVQCLACSDYYVREAAAQSLEKLADTRCIPNLIGLLTDFDLAGASSTALPPQPYDSILKALGTLQANAAISVIEPFLEHPQARISYAAARALYQLTGQDSYGERLVAALSGSSLQLRRAAMSDLGSIGYLPAATAIAQTHAENSLKLIALKGILESQLNLAEPEALSDAALQVMGLMDSLL